MGLPLEKLAHLKGQDLKNELSHLRGAHTFTTHNGKVPDSIKHKDGTDGAARNKKLLLVLLLVGVAAYMYTSLNP